MRHTPYLAVGLCVALLATVLVYLPGLAGPFLFDDTTNILQNAPLRITSLSAI